MHCSVRISPLPRTENAKIERFAYQERFPRHPKTGHPGAGGEPLLPARQPCGVCLDGQETKPVNMLSTLAQADVTRTAQRKQKDGSRISVQCTDAVVLYNKYMAGVDKGDQMRQYYRIRTKCTKYYK